MFGRLIGKIGSLTSTTHFRRFNQIVGNKVKKGFPAVTSKFEKLVDPRNIFVDKSLLITKLLDGKYDSFLITRPRRWGKTSNLDMIETFFQADMNKDTGMPDLTKQSKKYLFENLLIGKKNINYNLITGENKEKKIIDLQGKFPVIRITMEAPTITSKEKLFRAFARSIKNVFVKHKYILNSNKKNFLIEECALMNKYLFKSEREITWGDIGVSLNYLIKALYMHYDSKVVLLIDEYDKIITDLFLERSENCSDAVELFKNLVHQIKDNKKLLFTVFAGVTRLAKAGIFSGLNHFYHDSVVNSELSQHFGFTEAEVNFLLNELIKFKPELSKTEVKKLITEWYKGYKIGNQTIYNPWSIMHCFDSL